MNNNNSSSRNNDSGNWGQRQPTAAVASSSPSGAFRLHFSPSQRGSRSYGVGGRSNETTTTAFDVDDDDEDRNSSNLSSRRWNAIPATFRLSKDFKRIDLTDSEDDDNDRVEAVTSVTLRRAGSRPTRSLIKFPSPVAATAASTAAEGVEAATEAEESNQKGDTLRQRLCRQLSVRKNDTAKPMGRNEMASLSSVTAPSKDKDDDDDNTIWSLGRHRRRPSLKMIRQWSTGQVTMSTDNNRKNKPTRAKSMLRQSHSSCSAAAMTLDYDDDDDDADADWNDSCFSVVGGNSSVDFAATESGGNYSNNNSRNNDSWMSTASADSNNNRNNDSWMSTASTDSNDTGISQKRQRSKQQRSTSQTLQRRSSATRRHPRRTRTVPDRHQEPKRHDDAKLERPTRSSSRRSLDGAFDETSTVKVVVVDASSPPPSPPKGRELRSSSSSLSTDRTSEQRRRSSTSELPRQQYKDQPPERPSRQRQHADESITGAVIRKDTKQGLLSLQRSPSASTTTTKRPTQESASSLVASANAHQNQQRQSSMTPTSAAGVVRTETKNGAGPVVEENDGKPSRRRRANTVRRFHSAPAIAVPHNVKAGDASSSSLATGNTTDARRGDDGSIVNSQVETTDAEKDVSPPTTQHPTRLHQLILVDLWRDDPNELEARLRQFNDALRDMENDVDDDEDGIIDRVAVAGVSTTWTAADTPLLPIDEAIVDRLGVASPLAGAIGKWASHGGVLGEILRLIYALVLSTTHGGENLARSFVECGVVTAVVAAMRAFASDESIQVSGCGALYAILSIIFANNVPDDNAAAAFVSAGGPAAIGAAIRAFPSCKLIQQRGALVDRYVAQPCQDLRLEIGATLARDAMKARPGLESAAGEKGTRPRSRNNNSDANDNEDSNKNGAARRGRRRPDDDGHPVAAPGA